jgi:hypothetical protein
MLSIIIAVFCPEETTPVVSALSLYLISSD